MDSSSRIDIATQPHLSGPAIPPPRMAPAATPPASRLGDLVPVPVSVRPYDVTYTLAPDAVIRTTPDAAAVGDYLADLLRRPTGYPLPVVPTDAPGVGVSLLRTAEVPASLGAEGYELEVTRDGVVIRARTASGLFYGVQTLRQLLPAAIESDGVRPGPWTVPGGRIIDYPRFGYRGAMLDVARHFFTVADVQRYLDDLVRYKINHLHLHLTDDQGWRIAIDSWPRLATVGGAGAVGAASGGWYRKDEYRQIVAYAAARHVTIVPEIDLPGHTNAALTAYPALHPDGVAPPPYTGTDVGFSTLAVDRELTYRFITDVLGEVAALTPGPYLHIGGDEAWKLAKDDYRAFMNRVQPIVVATGKVIMGWHQLAVADHVPGRILQFWGTSPTEPAVAEAVRQGARLVLSPGNRAYLDMKYAADTPLGKDWAGFVEVRDAYDWDPGAYLADVPAEAVLGVEAPLWTETMATLDQLRFMTFPRLPAIAELGWSPAGTRDWPGFRQRLATHTARWNAAGIAYHPSPQVPWSTAGAVAPQTVPPTAAATAPAQRPAPADSHLNPVGPE